jgi:hypothetical protein
MHQKLQFMFEEHSYLITILREANLTNKYSLIQNGEKVKFIFLKKPNIIHENVISFIQDFPKRTWS